MPSACQAPSSRLKSGNLRELTLLMISAAMFFAVPHSWSQATELPPELAALDAQFQSLQNDRVFGPFVEGGALLNHNYFGNLQKALAAEKAAGNLDAVLALEAEKQRFTDKPSVPDKDDANTPASLKALRDTYRAALAKLEAQRAINLKALTDPLSVRLAQMQADFTKADRLEDAKAVRSYRDELAKKVPAGVEISPVPTPTGRAGHTNSLGMKFLPVPGTGVLMCIHETRRQDYAAYAAEVRVDGAWKNQQRDGVPVGDKDDHPVVCLSWDESAKFCQWLSKKEGKTYRLPTDEEWSIAVGLGEKERPGQGTTPEMLSKKETTEFPWGGDYPPKTSDKAGNFADESWHEKIPNPPWIEKYNDGFPTTAPVMSFKPNKLGFYDMGGNVKEWVDSWWNASQTERVLRDSCFSCGTSRALLSSRREKYVPDYRWHTYGFRVVLVR